MRTSIATIASLSILNAACANQKAALDPAQEAELRAHKPAPLQERAGFDAPVPASRKLDNGLTVLVVENHALPLVAMELALLTGVDAEPAGNAGIANFTARMLLEGTERRSALELATALDDLAAVAWANAQAESTRVHMNALRSSLPRAVELFAEVVRQPGFRDADVQRLAAIHRTELLQKQGVPWQLADDQVARLLWGESSALGQPSGGTLATLAATAAADVRAFHAAQYRPANAVLVFAGDIGADEAEQIARQHFGSWTGEAARPQPIDPPAVAPGAVTLVPKEGSQSQVWRAAILPFGAADPRAVQARLLNFTLGGTFTSRLNTNVRETKGYSYGVNSQVRPYRSRCLWIASGGIVADKTAEALAEYHKELQRLAEGGVTDDELAQAKQAYVRILPSALETNDQVATAIAGLVASGLPLDYYRTLPGKVAAITREDLGKLAAGLFAPQKWTSVVVGPAASAARLRELQLGTVEERAVQP